MNIKRNIRKFLLVVAVAITGGAILVLLAAAISKKNHKTCSGVSITVSNGDGHGFLSKKDVLQIIAPAGAGALAGQPLAAFNLKQMETSLKQNDWVNNAEIFFDNTGILRVSVDEREPVARIFSVSGASFYVDSSGRQLPLSSKVNLRLPVFTSFPTDEPRRYHTDSLLLAQVTRIGRFISADSFWTAQVAQVDILPDRRFQLVPVVGRQLIDFGDGNDYAAKFHRLLLFYQQVASKGALNLYSEINVAFNGQVIATRKGTTSKVDSIQALKNVRQMIEASRTLANDSLSTTVDNNIVSNGSPVPTLTILKERMNNVRQKDSLNKVPSSTHPPPLKSRASQPQHNPQHPPLVRKPKAIMERPSG